MGRLDIGVGGVFVLYESKSEWVLRVNDHLEIFV